MTSRTESSRRWEVRSNQSRTELNRTTLRAMAAVQVRARASRVSSHVLGSEHANGELEAVAQPEPIVAGHELVADVRLGHHGAAPERDAEAGLHEHGHHQGRPVLVLARAVGGAPGVMARDAVRDAIERARRYPVRSTPEQIEDSRRAAEKRRAAHADELAGLRRVIVHAFPARAPRIVVLVDVEKREFATYLDEQLADLGRMLDRYEVLCGVDIRATLRELAIDPGDRRLAELGPPQKSIRLDRSGRTLTITTAMLVQGSCGIRRPFGDPHRLRAYLARGQITQLQPRLEADAQSLLALHQYGKLHGCVRLRRGSLDRRFPVPWHHYDEPTLYHLKREAHRLAMGIIAVVGSAPGWEDPWALARRLDVVRGASEHELMLFDELGRYVDDRDVQLARLEAVVH